jgi:AcrR family transcriptional regulator
MEKQRDMNDRVREPVQRRSIEKKARIVQSARELFNEVEFDAVTTSGIAERAGVSVGTLYSYFRNKHDIFYEVVEAFNKNIYDRFVSGLRENMTDTNTLEETIDAVLSVLWDIHMHEKTLHNEIVVLAYKDEKIKSSFSENERLLLERIMEILNRYSDEIEVAGPNEATFVLKHAVNGVLDQLLKKEPNLDPNKVLKELGTMVVKYLKKS